MNQKIIKGAKYIYIYYKIKRNIWKKKKFKLVENEG